MLAVVVRRRCDISLNRCAARMRTPPDLLKSAASTIEDAYSGGRRIGAAAWSRARGWRPWRAAARLGEERGSGAGRDDDGDVATAQRRRRRGRSGVRRRGAPQRWALGLAVAVACPSVAVHDFGRGDVDAAGRGVTTRRGGAARRPGAEKASCGNARRAERGAARRRAAAQAALGWSHGAREAGCGAWQVRGREGRHTQARSCVRSLRCGARRMASVVEARQEGGVAGGAWWRRDEAQGAAPSVGPAQGAASRRGGARREEQDHGRMKKRDKV